MWKWIKESFWFINALFTDNTTVSRHEETVISKIMFNYPRKKKHYLWWCGYVIFGLDTKISKIFREKHYTRYNMRFNQSLEFESWIYYYLVFLWQFICGKPWVSWKGAYYTCPFIIESLYFENKPESIYFVYPYGQYKNFEIRGSRQRAWKEGKRYWKTWIRENYESGNLGRDKKE